MKLLLDTHLLLWAAADRLPSQVSRLIQNSENELIFSSASIWEVAIKRNLGRKDFQLDPRLLRRGLLDNDYSELVIRSDHAIAVDGMPLLHRDPFDRILIAQALVEGVTLLTTDPLVAQYSGPVRKV